MINSVEFAKYLLNKAKEKQISVNYTQLQKFVYICDGTLLAFEQNLIDENCCVWEYGPVYPKIYKWYSKHKDDNSFSISPNSFAQIEATNIPKVVDLTLNKFGAWTSVELSNWSHQKGSPWYIAKNNRGMFSKIDKFDMKHYFKGILKC